MLDKDVMEERKKKKEELQKSYLEALAKRKKQKTKKQVVNWETRYEEEKKKRKNEQKKLQQAERKHSEVARLKRQHQEKIQEERRKQQALTTAVKRKEEEVKQLKKAIIQLEREHSKGILLIKEQMKEKQFQEQQQLTDTLRTSQTARAALQQKYVQMEQELRQYRQKATINKTIEKVEKQTVYQQEIRTLRYLNQELQRKLQSYENLHKPAELLTALRHGITAENISAFYTDNKNQLTELAKKVERLQLEKQYKKIQQKADRRQKWQEPNESQVKLGYMSKHKSTWYFFDTSTASDTLHEIYEVRGNATNSKFQNELPVKCIVPDGKYAVVTEVFEEHNLPEKPVRIYKSKEQGEIKDKKVYPYFGDARILIIGSRNLSIYQQRLIQHGLEVDTHNPFEESYPRLDGKYQRADIVIVCTSHISHSVYNHVDKNHPKVELIERDNEEWITARVRFTMMKLNLGGTLMELTEELSEENRL
ncbi:hypothetical protein CN918_26390 [Priestia megaterium]|nr:hypothetical protein CN918_26390 [Priestia megaterium]